METTKNETPLGARLATRYVPNQILTSSLPWGHLIGAEEVSRLEKWFVERSITKDDDPAITKEWFVHYMMEILEEKSNALLSATELESMVHGDIHFLDERKMPIYREEVFQWVSSFSIQLSVHDPLWDACETSNAALVRVERSNCSNSYASSTTGVGFHGIGGKPLKTAHSNEGRPRKGRLERSRSVARMLLNFNTPSTHVTPQRKEPVRHEMVRWSDLTTNFVRDYEHFHRFDEKEMSFTRVRSGLSSGRTTRIRSPHGKDAGETGWSRVLRDGKDLDTDALTQKEMHLQSADQILLSPLTGYIITSSKDGIVKLWNGETGVFMRNLYNAGASWVIGMFLLPDEDYILIATTNSQLTVLDFPDGNVLQKYIGCDSLQTALYEVVQLSATNIQRYGMKPGECGAYRVALREDETSEQYHRRRREAQNDVFSKTVPAKPVVSFTFPTASWFDTYTGIFFFGSTSGLIGAFDIAADIRPSLLLAGANSKPVSLLFSMELHVGPVVGMFYTSYVTSLFTAGSDGSIYRVPLGTSGKPSGEPRLITHQPRAIRSMQWWPPSKFYTTIHVDRRVSLWVIGRHGDALHHFPSESQEVVSAALHPRHQRLAVLLSDKTIKVYETHANKSLAIILQPEPESNFTATDASREMMERSSSDEDGVVAWHPYHSCLVCCLRAAMIYEPTKNHHQSDSAEGSQTGLAEGNQGRSSCDTPNETITSNKVGQSVRTSVSFLVPRRMDSHGSGVVAMAVQRQTWGLHTFDEDTWRLWELETGIMKRHIDIPRVAKLEHMPIKRATVASCSWTTSAQTRLATGGQDSSLLTWDPITGSPLATEMLVQDISEQLDSDVSLMSHRNKLIAWSARICSIISFDSGALLPNGLEDSKSVVVRVPSLTSVTACCVVRDAYLCMGTCDAMIYFFSLRGGAPIHDCVLREKPEEDKGAVVHIIFLNEQNQNLLLIILDIGILIVYSYVNQAIVYRMRLVKRFECRISIVLHIPEDGTVMFGDTLGRVRVFDVRGCTSLSVEFRHAFILRATFQGATDEITSLEHFHVSGQRYLVVGSLDHQVRLFHLDSNWLHSPLSSLSLLQSASATVKFVGSFGRDVWKLSDPTTYSENAPQATSPVECANAAEDEMLLENILHADVRSESSRTTIDFLVDDDAAPARSRSHRNTRVQTPSSGTGSAKAGPVCSFFLTDISTGQEEQTQAQAQAHSFSLHSFAENPRPPVQRAQERQGSPVSLLPAEGVVASATTTFTANANAGGAGVATGGGFHSHSTPPTPGIMCRSQARAKVCDVPPHGVDPASAPGSHLDTLSFHPAPFSGTLSLQKKRSALLTMTRRLEAVLSRGFGNGELTRNANELLMGDAGVGAGVGVAGMQGKTKEKGRRPERGELQSALETRRKIEERMEDYKKRQAERRGGKRGTLPRVALKHQLVQVVFPQPTMIPNEVKASYAWMLNTQPVELPKKPSAHASNIK